MWTQTTKLTAADAAEGDKFGIASPFQAIVIVGAYGDDDGGRRQRLGLWLFYRGADGMWAQTVNSPPPMPRR